MVDRKSILLQLFFSLLIAAGILLTSSCAHVRQGQKEKAYLLIGKIDNLEGTIKTDKGVQNAVFRGQLTFRATPDDKGKMSLTLIRLNLLSKGVMTSRGNTGNIGLSLAKMAYPTMYRVSDGTLEVKPRLKLHYPLIDKIKGFRSKGLNGDTNFIPFTEEMKGVLVGKFSKELQPKEGEILRFNGEMLFELEDDDQGLVPIMRCVISLELIWAELFESAEVLKIQPVFIGTGAGDPTATGSTFDTLIRRASDLWNRCGTERCIRLLVDPPMYINNDDYRILDNEPEARAFKDEVDIVDAIEIFVAERFVDAMAVLWGGGGTIGSGTASAKIVTSDQNLDVPCPEPCTTHESTPGNNAGMCARSGDTLGCGDVNYQHLSHELGHVLNLGHPLDPGGLSMSTANSVMEPSGLCCDNPDIQSALNCRNASNPVLFWDRSACDETPDILD
jgi:hypothetical protein